VPNVKATFHHAFEDSDNKLVAINAIQQLRNVDRILSSGGSGDPETRLNLLTQYQTAVKAPVEIIAGGGIDSNNISLIKTRAGIREFHVGRAAREGFKVDGGVSAELVAGLSQLLNRF
jgi:copper homeostasis protein